MFSDEMSSTRMMPCTDKFPHVAVDPQFLLAGDHQIAVGQFLDDGGGQIDHHLLLALHGAVAVDAARAAQADQTGADWLRQTLCRCCFPARGNWACPWLPELAVEVVVWFFSWPLSLILTDTVRMSPISVARWSLKKARAPGRHNELVPGGGAVGVGMGMLTGL